MTSNVNVNVPDAVYPTTASVRSNFVTIKSEIEALQADVTGKQDALVSGTDIKTVNGESLLGAGNLVVSGGGGTKVAKFTISGTLSTGLTQGALRWYPEEDITITGVYFSLGTAGSVAANINKNGSQMLASNIVTGASDNRSNTGVPGSPNVLTTDYITVNMIAFVSTAANFVLHIVYQKT